MAALDAETGAIAWRAYSTGPDKDVLIGPAFNPFYPSDRGADLGLTTWPAEAWRTGGGSVWGWISYDPDLNLIYYGTSNPGPWNPDQRPGDNKWTAGMFARVPETGDARWFYQTSPHDLFDHDGVNELVLADLTTAGQARKVAMRADRNGLFYVMDRATGEVLSATPFGYVNSNKGVDMKTGRLIPVDGEDSQARRCRPRHLPRGARDERLAADVVLAADRAGLHPASEPLRGHRNDAGELHRRNTVCRRQRRLQRRPWRKPRRSHSLGSGRRQTRVADQGALSGLERHANHRRRHRVLRDDGRWFKAVDAGTGELLWQFKCGSGIIGQPITYKGPDGRQYVAMLSGVGGWAGAMVSDDLDPRDATAGNGFGAAFGDLKEATTRGGMLYVFSLGGSVK